MALNLIFIGCNEEQTRLYFADFVRFNQDQIVEFSPRQGWIVLCDGTLIRRAPSTKEAIVGHHFDQIIVACDRRGVWNWPDKRLELLQELYRGALRRQVLEEDTVIIYELDADGEDRI